MSKDGEITWHIKKSPNICSLVYNERDTYNFGVLSADSIDTMISIISSVIAITLYSFYGTD